MKNVLVERVIRDGGSRVALKFPYDNELIMIEKTRFRANAELLHLRKTGESDIAKYKRWMEANR